MSATVNKIQSILRDHQSALLRARDGTHFSVAASPTNYSEPRGDVGPWSRVEVGYPSRAIHHFLKYAEEPNTPTHTVYPYVPVETVALALLKHGGLVAFASTRPRRKRGSGFLRRVHRWIGGR